MHTEAKIVWKRFCESLKKHTKKIKNFKNRKNKLLTNKHHQWYENAKICYICKEKFEEKYGEDKEYLKVSNHCH